MISSAPRYRPNDFVITPFHDACGGAHANTAAPTSGVWPSANRAVLYPVSLPEPFTVAKAYWCNGATVGTDSIDMGIYMVDFSAGRADLMRSLGGVLSAGTANVVQETATWKVARANITNNFSNTDATSYATASVTLKAGKLYLMAVTNTAASAGAISAITGGPTFTSRSTTQFNTASHRVSLWSAVPTADYTGTLTIDFGGGNTQTACVWSLEEFAGVDTTTTDGVVQSVIGTGTGTTPLATLAAFGNANNATFGINANVSDTTTTPGAGFTEIVDIASGTPVACMLTQWQVGYDTTSDGTITSAAWGAIAAEIKADASSPIIPVVSLLSAVRPYMAFVLSGTTATVFRATIPANIMGLAGRLTTNSAYPLPSTMTPAINVGPSEVLGGFSSRTLIG